MKKVVLSALTLIWAALPSYAQNSPDDLARRAIERRAVEAVIWGMPVVNYDLMYQEMARKAKGEFNQIVYWSRLLDWKNQTLTPNPDVIYLMPFFNTKDVGPVVLEVPPADEVPQNGLSESSTQLADNQTFEEAILSPTTMTLLRITLAAIAGSAIVTIAALSLSLQGRFNSRSLL